MFRRTGRWLGRKTQGWSRLKLAIVAMLVAMLATLGGVIAGTAAVVATGTENFCSNACHEMNIPAAEFKSTKHDANRTGVRATCADCHIPHHSVVAMLAEKTRAGTKDIWGHFVTGVIDTKEKYEKERHRMAVSVWTTMKQTDSRECRHCHNAAKMDPDLQSETAKKKHEALKTGMTCIDCHSGIAHNEPDGPGPQELKIAK